MYGSQRVVAVVVAGLLASWSAGASADERDEILRWGHPETGRILVRDGYVLSHDGRTRTARWVAEWLTPERLTGPGDRSRSSFRPDVDVPVEFRATLDDYRGSGFDRGHLAPAADHVRSQGQLDGTFVLSNAAPQHPSFNRGYWSTFEATVRDLADRPDLDGVWVFTGPLWMPDDAPPAGTATESVVTYTLIGPNHVPIPTHFFKAILGLRLDGPILWAFVLPNRAIPSDTPLNAFAVSTDYLEHWSGLDLWSAIDDEQEDALEATVNRLYPLGDFDADGHVGLADYLILRAAIERSSTMTTDAQTDLDGDGDTDLADLVVFQAAFTGAR